MIVLRAVLLLAVTVPTRAGTQTVPADAGTLVVRRHGTIVAREDYQIRRDGPTLTVTSSAHWPASTQMVLAVYSPRRVTVRVSGTAGEIAREFPTGGTMIFDDSAFVFLLLLPLQEPGAIRVARPRATDRAAGTLAARADPRGLRVIEVRVDGLSLRAWFGADGRFLRAELPDLGIEVSRADSQ